MIAHGQRYGDKIMRKWMMIALALPTATAVARAQDPAAGQNSFTLCAICHAVGEGAQNKLGPILNGLDGRRSGSVRQAIRSGRPDQMSNTF
jgi:cytochrome c